MDSQEIETSLRSIEKRLNIIEDRLRISQGYVASKPQTSLQETGIELEPITEEAPPSPSSSGNWLGAIAVICFVMAAGFIIKLSIDAGWLTPARQIGLAALFGFGLIGGGLTLLKSDKEYASFLPGAGIIVLYLTAFAAHLYHGIISFDEALVSTSIVSLLCLWLYTKIKHDIYPTTAALGAYLSPLLMGFNASNDFTIFYFFLCSVAFSSIAVMMKTRTLILVSSYLAILATALVGFNIQQHKLVATFLALQFVLFSTSAYFYTRWHSSPLSKAEATSFLPVLLLFYAFEYNLIDSILPALAPWLSLAFAGLLGSLYLSAKRYFPDSLESRSLIAAFGTIVAFHAVYLELMPDAMRPWLFVVIISVAGAFCDKLLSSSAKDWQLSIPVIAVFLVLAIEYHSMLHKLSHAASFEWIAVSLAALAALWFANIRIRNNINYTGQTYGQFLLAATHLLAIVAFYNIARDAGSFAVSVLWLLYGTSVIVLAHIRKDGKMAKSALYVLGFSAAKALLVDAASAPTVVRIACLMLTGGVLYGCGLFLRNISSWDAPKREIKEVQE